MTHLHVIGQNIRSYHRQGESDKDPLCLGFEHMQRTYDEADVPHLPHLITDKLGGREAQSLRAIGF